MIALLNHHFVPVSAANQEYAQSNAIPPEEKAEKMRIYRSALEAGRPAGTVCVYILGPDTRLLDSLIVSDAAKPQRLLQLLQRTIDQLQVAPGPALVTPARQSSSPPSVPGSLVLHLTARYLQRQGDDYVRLHPVLGTERSGQWAHLPSEDWVVFARAEQQKLLPVGDVHPGTSWELDREVMARLLRHFYPPTENTDVRRNHLDQQTLRATVLSLHDGVARAWVQGRLRMRHSFYHKDTDEFVAADVVGVLEFEPGRPRVRSLRLVTDRATYGQAHARLPFGVAVRSAAEVSGQGAVVQDEFLFTAAPFRECHASTIAQTRAGTLLAAWFGGTREGHPDVGIWVARQTDGRWGKPVEVATGVAPSGPRRPCWNPVLFQPGEGPVLLFYKVGPSPASWWGMLTTSADDGRTWSVPRRLPEGILGPIKDKPVQLPSGDLLCPSSTEDHGWRIHFERTADLGKSWTRTGPLNDGQEIAAIQPSILFHRAGRLQALCRSRQGRVCQTWSRDQGRTWSALELTDLPNPNSGLDAVTLADGRHLLVYNHTTRGRTPLNVALSEDGRTWKAALVLEREPGEFSYPAVVQTRDGLVHLTYTWKRQRIKHVVLDPKTLVLTDLDPP